MLFQLRECVHPQDGATPSFFYESGALYWCFQLMYHLFWNSFGKLIKTLKIEQAVQYIWRTLYRSFQNGVFWKAPSVLLNFESGFLNSIYPVNARHVTSSFSKIPSFQKLNFWNGLWKRGVYSCLCALNVVANI